LIGVISPWNFPFLLSLIDAIPALFAGCSIIIKPSEVTPRFTRSLMQAIANTPHLKDVLSIVLGDGALGAKLISHVDGICFTGSVDTGRKVAVSAAQQLIPAFLELGGKDAALVFEDVDLDRTAASLIWGSMANAGQVCLSIERVYIQQSIYQALADKLSSQASSLTLCQGEAWQSGQIGPIIAEPQAKIIQAQLDDARSKGRLMAVYGVSPL
jgi:succinate-semialdehyde dehydrogenase/glutarate-semialdehyde dehydrogenase